MRKVVKEFSLALGLATLWFISVYFAAEVWLPSAWAFQCGLVNAILGTLALYLVTRTEKGAEMFYEGPRNGGWLVGCWPAVEHSRHYVHYRSTVVGIAVSVAIIGLLETVAKDIKRRG